MSDILVSIGAAAALGRTAGRRAAWVSRGILVIMAAAAMAAGFLAAGAEDAARAAADADLTRLLRAMAALKFVMALAAVGAVFWRLGSPAGPAWLGAYAVSCGALFAGPGLIWGMAHLGMGALLLHGGLAATIILLWRDPVVGRRLEAAVATRRAALRAAGGSR
jgi:hypothetical protein